MTNVGNRIKKHIVLILMLTVISVAINGQATGVNFALQEEDRSFFVEVRTSRFTRRIDSMSSGVLVHRQKNIFLVWDGAYIHKLDLANNELTTFFDAHIGPLNLLLYRGKIYYTAEKTWPGLMQLDPETEEIVRFEYDGIGNFYYYHDTLLYQEEGADEVYFDLRAQEEREDIILEDLVRYEQVSITKLWNYYW